MSSSRSAETEVFRICNLVQPQSEGKVNTSRPKVKDIGRDIVKKKKSFGFSLVVSLPERRGIFLVGLCIILLSPKYFLELRLLCINFFFPSDQNLSLSNTDQGSGFPVSVAFCTSVSEISLLDITSYLEEKVYRLQIMRVIFK